MSVEELQKLWEKHGGEFLKFDRIPPHCRRSGRPDLHAFLLLDQLVSGGRDMVSAAGHDEIFLAVGPEDLAGVVTEEQVAELIRCGVRLDAETGSLALFV